MYVTRYRNIFHEYVNDMKLIQDEVVWFFLGFFKLCLLNYDFNE